MSIEQLKSKLAAKQGWIQTKYNYYEQKGLRPDPSPIIPQRDVVVYHSTLDWCARAVDSLANRLTFDGFENDNFYLWDVFKMNNKDIIFDSAIRSALISACCFVYISADEDGEPRLQVIDGKNATGTIDPVTNLLTEGYAILDVDEYGNPTLEAYFTPEYTEYFANYSKRSAVGEYKNHTTIPNPSGYPLLVPIIYRPDAKRPFGQSRISKTLIDLMDKARFTITRAEVCGEFATIPQKYVLGLSPDAEFDTIKNAYKQMLAIDKDSEGDKPVVGQFQQGSLTPHINQFMMYKEEFDRAASLDSAENLENVALKAQDTFGYGFLNVGLVSASLRDQVHYLRKELYETTPIWKPVYRIDNSVINSFGDGIIKLNQAVPNAIDVKAVRKMTGLPVGEIE